MLANAFLYSAVPGGLNAVTRKLFENPQSTCALSSWSGLGAQVKEPFEMAVSERCLKLQHSGNAII